MRMIAERMKKRGKCERHAQLKEVWSELLGIPREAIEDESSFLELGGNSMLFLSLQVEVARKLGVEISYDDLLSFMTFADMCDLVVADHP